MFFIPNRWEIPPGSTSRSSLITSSCLDLGTSKPLLASIADIVLDAPYPQSMVLGVHHGGWEPSSHHFGPTTLFLPGPGYASQWIGAPSLAHFNMSMLFLLRLAHIYILFLVIHSFSMWE